MRARTTQLTATSLRRRLEEREARLSEQIGDAGRERWDVRTALRSVRPRPWAPKRQTGGMSS